MIKIILPKAKVRVSSLMGTTRLAAQKQRRCIATTKICTYKTNLGIPNMFDANESINNPNNDSPNDITNEYNDYSSTDDLQIRLKEFITGKPVFVNAYNDYKKKDLSLTTETSESIEETSRISNPNYREMVNTNENMPPNTGSFIEINDPRTSSVTFGMVLKGSKTKFNENYNKLLVLTVDNEIKNIYPQDISFHLFEVLDPSWVESLKVIDSRHDPNFGNRMILLDILKSFIEKSFKLLQRLQDPNNNQFLIAFSQYATPSRMKGISLPDLYESFKFLGPVLSDINSSYYNQSIFLLSCHLGMINSPDMWIVSSCYKVNKLTNIVKDSCTNEICSGSNYFVNSITNMESLSKVFDDFDNPTFLDKYNEFLRMLFMEQTSLKPKSFDDLNVFFNIWDGKDFKNILNALKFYIIYPHTLIRERIEKLSVLGYQDINPSAVYKFLEELKIYNNRQNQMTDIYLSANIMGNTQLSQVAISSINELSATSSQKELEMLDSKNIADKFPHLRKSKEYYQDHIIYGIPFGKPHDCNSESSVLGISLEKINSRRYLINIHIPDLITKISPSSNLFDNIASTSINMKSLTKLINDSVLNIFNSNFIEKVSFPDQKLFENADWFSVGDVSLTGNQYGSKKKASSNVTCMTISFTYNMYESNPFLDLEEKISFSFDLLNSVQIKNIDWNTLEKCLNGVTEISPFTLFKGRRSSPHQEKPAKLDDDDFRNINFIFNVMKSHIKIRNLEGAANFDPSITFQKNDSSNLSKQLSVINNDEHEENVVTKIQSKSIEDELKFSKSKFFINELDKFIGKLTSRYCSMHQIPIFAHHQDVLESLYDEQVLAQIIKPEESQLNDEAYISHNNLFLPNYHSKSFFQTLIARDSSGYVSMAAYWIGLNYLTKPNIEVFTDENLRFLPLGIDNGYVKMLDIFTDYEVLLNQLQILSHVQQFAQGNNLTFFKDNEHSAIIKQFSYLKRNGYKLNGPLSYQGLNNQLVKIKNAYTLCDYLGTVHKHFWTLKLLEQRLQQESLLEPGTNGIAYECIITNTGYELLSISKRIARGYCSQLNIEIDVLISLDRDLSIGNQIDCDKVMFLDSISGDCILRESQLIH